MSLDTVLLKINTEILNPIILLLFGAALVLFLWGGFMFIRDAASDEGRETGKRALFWGIVGMVIMVSVYGILRLAVNTFGVDLPPY